MASQMDRLEEQLRRVDEHSQSVVNAAVDNVPQRPQNEMWWRHVVGIYGDEGVLFQRTGVDHGVFLDSLALVRDVHWEPRGRRSVINTNRERLFFLMVFLASGVRVLEVLVANFLKNRGHIVTLVKKIAERFLPLLAAGTIRYYNEAVPDVPECALIVDCTVCQIKRPALNFNEAKTFFSGKHNIYCLKKEVCVNVHSGTAAVVSRAFPGSVHDINVLRSHADEVNDILAGRSLLADLGYRGANVDVPTIIVCDATQQERRVQRVLVECFFGRLKRLWRVFSTTWLLGEEAFDTFFDLACCFTNMDILHRPLRDTDRIFNLGVLNLVRRTQEDENERRRLANRIYNERRRARLAFLEG